jgi:hypothetical protein
MKLNRGELIISIMLVGFGIFIATLSYRLGLGTRAKPGPGMMPFFASILLSLCSLPILSRNVLYVKKGKKPEEKGVWTQVDFRKIALIFFSIIVFLVLQGTLGFVVATFFCLFILFKWVGSMRLIWTLFAAVLTVFIVYFLFVIILRVYMPPFPYL